MLRPTQPRSRHRIEFAVAVTIFVLGMLLPASSATATVEVEPVVPELDQLPNGDQPISLQFENVPAAEGLNSIASAGNLRIVMEGPTDCCLVSLYLNDIPLRRALELFAAQTDARFQLARPDTLRVWLPETLMPDGENGVTLPVILNRSAPVYPQDARDARAGGTVMVWAVIRYDGTIGRVIVLDHAEGWPSLDEAVVAAVRKRTYRPAMKNGEPVSVYFPIRVDFALR
jgi:TonB family protein